MIKVLATMLLAFLVVTATAQEIEELDIDPLIMSLLYSIYFLIRKNRNN